MRVTPEFAARLPWVTRLPATQECDSYRYAHMTARALRDPVVRARFKCRGHARWQYDALDAGLVPGARSGVFCWSHMLVQLHSMAESERLAKWYTGQSQPLSANRPHDTNRENHADIIP